MIPFQVGKAENVSYDKEVVIDLLLDGFDKFSIKFRIRLESLNLC